MRASVERLDLSEAIMHAHLALRSHTACENYYYKFVCVRIFTESRIYDLASEGKRGRERDCERVGGGEQERAKASKRERKQRWRGREGGGERVT